MIIKAVPSGRFFFLAGNLETARQTPIIQGIGSNILNHESARARLSKTPQLRMTDLPFAQVPHQSRLFLEYQEDAQKLRKYYPNAVSSIGQLSIFSHEVLAAYKTDRNTICDALVEINLLAKSCEKTFANIEHLRDAQTVAVVTGQQAGLFTGPLYTIYKALSAVRMAADLTAQGTPAVPIFWAATEDHDFEEVAASFAIDRTGELFEVTHSPTTRVPGSMVGDVVIDNSVGNIIGDLFERLPATEFSSELRQKISEIWQNGARFGEAFTQTIAYLFRDHGLIIIDPLNASVRKLSSQIVSRAIDHSDEIESALISRSEQLASDGYHVQVLIEPGYFPLFWIDEEGRRNAIRKIGDDKFRVKVSTVQFTRQELLDMATKTPDRFSPGVMLRPVVQDVLLPTVCYLGGGAEVAYFAQNSEVYRILERPATPILHRQSYTVVNHKQRRILDKFHLKLTDLFDGLEKTTLRLSETAVSVDTAKLFDYATSEIENELESIDQHLSAIDPTVAANLQTRRRKIAYHLATLKKKALLARIRKDTDLDRQLKGLFASLLPNGELQERTLNVFVVLNKFGLGFIDWLYEATDVENKDHRIVDL